jgi:hypothetical protein
LETSEDKYCDALNSAAEHVKEFWNEIPELVLKGTWQIPRNNSNGEAVIPNENELEEVVGQLWYVKLHFLM